MSEKTKLFTCQHCGQPNAVRVSVSINASPQATPVPLRSPNQGFLIESVVRFVADHYGLKMRELKRHIKESRIVLVRQIIMWLLVKHYDCTLIQAARAVGHEDHSTASHACARLAARRDRLDSFREETDQLAAAITQRFVPRSKLPPHPIAAIIVSGQGAAPPS